MGFISWFGRDFTIGLQSWAVFIQTHSILWLITFTTLGALPIFEHSTIFEPLGQIDGLVVAWLLELERVLVNYLYLVLTNQWHRLSIIVFCLLFVIINQCNRVSRVIFHDVMVLIFNTTKFIFLNNRIWQLNVDSLDNMERCGINFDKTESIEQEVEHAVQNYRACELIPFNLALDLNALNDPGLVDSSHNVNLDDFSLQRIVIYFCSD